jgi:hypothetical protein
MALMDGLRKAAKVTGNYVKDASEVGQRGGGKWQKAVDIVDAPFRVAGNAAADGLIKGTKVLGKSMVKDTTPGIANLWTGKRESKLAIGVAGAGVAAYAGVYGYGAFKLDTNFQPKVGTVSYGGTAPIMDADGVSTTPQAPLSNAPTLGANGNMVFGLHNARKG